MKYVPTPSEPSLWSNPALDAMAFAEHFFSFSRNFLGDYQMLFPLSPSQPSTLLEAQLIRYFLVEKVLREKCSDTPGRMRSRVINLNKHTWEGGVELKQMKIRRGDLKVLAKGVTSQARV